MHAAAGATSGSEVQPGLTGRVRQGGDAARVAVAGAVEDDRLDAGGLGTLGDQLADLASPGSVLSPSPPRMDTSRVDADASVWP